MSQGAADTATNWTIKTTTWRYSHICPRCGAPRPARRSRTVFLAEARQHARQCGK